MSTNDPIAQAKALIASDERQHSGVSSIATSLLKLFNSIPVLRESMGSVTQPLSVIVETLQRWRQDNVSYLLATVGLYGVMAYAVARRTREIGIRMALGAIQGNVLWMVMREVLALVGIGLAIGLPASFLLTRYVQSQLFGVQPNDPATFMLAVTGLSMIASLAG